MAELPYFVAKMSDIAAEIKRLGGVDDSIPYSVTSMISALMDLARIDDTEGVAAFMNRTINRIEIPPYASSIGPYAFAGCGGLSIVSKAKTLAYGSHAFDYCDPDAIPTAYNSDVAGTYDKGIVAPARIENGTGTGVIVDPVKVQEIRNASYNTIEKQMSGLANATRALLPGVTTKMTINDIDNWLSVDVVSGGYNNIVAKLIDRTINDLELTSTMYDGYIHTYVLCDCTNLSRLVLTKSGYIESGAMHNCHEGLHISCRDSTMIAAGALDDQESPDSSGAWFTYIGGSAAESCYYTVEYTTGYNEDGFRQTSQIDYLIASGLDSTIRYGCNQNGYDGDSMYSTEGTDGNGIFRLDFQNTSFVAKKAFANITVRDDCDLQSVNLTGVRFLDADVFAGNTGLSNVTFGPAMLKVNDHVFQMTGFTELTIPATVELIGKGVFAECTSLVSVCYNVYTDSAPAETFTNCSNLISAVVAGFPTTLGESMFNGCSSLKTVELPYTVSRFEGGLFQGCEALTSVNLPTNLTYVGPYAFAYCTSLGGTMDFKSTKLKELYGNAFAGTGLSRFIFPSTVTHIDSDAFWNTPAGTVLSCYFPKSVISNADGYTLERIDPDNIHFLT